MERQKTLKGALHAECLRRGSPPYRSGLVKNSTGQLLPASEGVDYFSADTEAGSAATRTSTGDFMRLACHVVKELAKVAYQTEPDSGWQAHPLENRWRIVGRRTALARHHAPRGPVQELQILGCAHVQKALVTAATTIGTGASTEFAIALIEEHWRQTCIHQLSSGYFFASLSIRSSLLIASTMPPVASWPR